MTPPKRKAPDGLKAGGTRLWTVVTSDYELSEHESILLGEAARTVDALDGLQTLLDVDGLMSTTSQGARIHPALVELRQQRIALARLFTALRIPLDDLEGRTQTRGGARGVYGLAS